MAGENDAPSAVVGPDQTVDEGVAVSLDGTASSDPENEALSYLWRAPAGVTLDDVSTATPRFSAPEVLLLNARELEFRLTVTDARGRASAPASVIISVVDINNQPPFAYAGPAQTVAEGALVSLNGTASSRSRGRAAELCLERAG